MYNTACEAHLDVGKSSSPV